MAKKTITTVRLSHEARLLLEALSQSYGLSHTAIMELAVREKARRDKVTTPRSTHDATPPPTLAAV